MTRRLLPLSAADLPKSNFVAAYPDGHSPTAVTTQTVSVRRTLEAQGWVGRETRQVVTNYVG